MSLVLTRPLDRPSSRPSYTAPSPSTGNRSRGGLLAAAGPAVLVSAGYVDPGNWGTDVAAGTHFGYRLLWVLAAAMLAAVFLQQLAARLGLASGHDLAALMHTRLPRRVSQCLTAPLLLALAVTEVVEILGVVLGVHLLTGCNDVVASLVGAGLVLVALAMRGRRSRRLIGGCLVVVVVTYLVALCANGAAPFVAGAAPPSLPPGSSAIALGLVGSVIMPHNILLHTALARDQSRAPGPHETTGRTLRRSLVANSCALGLAFAVNVAITSMAATAPAGTASDGMHAAATGLQSHFGSFASLIFAGTLLASGLASATTGGLAGVDAFARLAPRSKLPGAARPLMFVAPAAAIACSPLPQISVLVWSQVVLTCALPVVLIPLVWFVTRVDLMGRDLPNPVTRTCAVLATVAIVAAGALSLV